MSDRLTHVAESGEAKMVDVSHKVSTQRNARATGSIRMKPETLSAIMNAEVKKGDVLGVARIAGVMAAKKTSDLIPLCHPLALTDVQVTLTPDEKLPGLRCEASAKTNGPTGVEMEALTAVSVAALAVYDMIKAVDRGAVIEGIRLLEKSGGKSGHWTSAENE